MGLFRLRTQRPLAWPIRCALLLVCFLCPMMGWAYTLPDSGQTKCFDDTQQIECPTSETADYYGQDGTYLSVPANVLDNGDGTVTDNNTNLTWQQNPNRTSLAWAEATAYCTSARDGGYADWRLPSRREIATTIFFNRDSPTFPYLMENANTSESFWTSTESAADTTKAYTLSGGDAYSDVTSKTTASSSIATRCVRGEALPSFSATVADSTITDSTTSLMWTKSSASTGKTWKDALSYCSGLESGNYTDWRLPTITELYTIIDDSRSNPALPPGFSSLGSPPALWSGTSLFANPAPAYAMVLSVNDARSYRGNKATGIGQLENELPRVLCVRSGPSVTPTLTNYMADAVTAPVADSQLAFSVKTTLQWSTTSLQGTTVDIYAINDSMSQLSGSSPSAATAAKLSAVKLAGNVSNSGSYAFYPAAMNMIGTKGKILVVSNSGCWAISPGYYTIASNMTAPVAMVATNVEPTSFTANWNVVYGSTSYLLTVGDATVQAIVPGYDALDVGNVLTYAVSGLTKGHTYQYVVKAKNSSSTTSASNVIDVQYKAKAGVAVNMLLFNETN